MLDLIKNKKGVTFIELLLYIAIFLVITPVLLNVSINSARQERAHVVEKQVNIDSQFMVERIYDLIADARQVDTANSVFDSPDGKLTLIMQDSSVVVIEKNPATGEVEITEGGVKTKLSAGTTDVESLYFERISDEVNDPEIVLGVNVRLNISGEEQHDVTQNYVTSANLERGDFDQDGCVDYLDKFPKHADCCGDSDDDGICDEMDNCVLKYNPFQEDFDGDSIGDTCDDSVFLGDGGGGGGDVAYNCSPDNQLISLIQEQPPLGSAQLKQILMSSSPLPPSVLMALIDAHPLLTNGHFRQVFVANTKLTSEVYNALAGVNLPAFQKFLIYMANALAQYVPWLGIDNQNHVNYSIETIQNECNPGEFYNNQIRLYNPDVPLGQDTSAYADIIIVNVNGGSDTVTITTHTASGTAVSTLTGGGDTLVDANGFQVTIESIVGSSYAFSIGNVNNTEALDAVEFNFGCGATIVSPTGSGYTSNRYYSYCDGGCSTNCGDIGTGIITGSVFTDRCYRSWDNHFPEWCSRWYTFEDNNNLTDNNSTNPAYVGGTSNDEQSDYWEKSFKTILSQAQIAELDSITVAGEVAYQSTNQFFCDTLNSTCVMKAVLVGPQNVELYNWNTHTWEVVGEMGLDGAISDQQKFEVIYNNAADVTKFIGGSNNREIKARIEFHRNGTPDPNQTKAPAFMLIDYFTLHLKW